MQWLVTGQNFTSDQRNIVLFVEFRVNIADVSPLWTNTYAFPIDTKAADAKQFLNNEASLLLARFNKAQAIPSLIGQSGVV
jgi:hypothetical protein